MNCAVAAVKVVIINRTNSVKKTEMSSLNERRCRVMGCDKCKYYIWYWDKCTKWDCIVDAREVHNCFEPISTPIYDYMVGKGGDTE